MPNHYDTDVYCLVCKRYMYSYLYDHEDVKKKFCSDKCEKKHKEVKAGKTKRS